MDTTEDFRYVIHKKINAHDTIQDVSKWGRKFSVKGDLILKKVHAIDPISELAKKKESVVFAIADTGEVWQVVIKSIKRGRSIMDKGGLHFRQSFHGGRWVEGTLFIGWMAYYYWLVPIMEGLEEGLKIKLLG